MSSHDPQVLASVFCGEIDTLHCAFQLIAGHLCKVETVFEQVGFSQQQKCSEVILAGSFQEILDVFCSFSRSRVPLTLLLEERVLRDPSFTSVTRRLHSVVVSPTRVVHRKDRSTVHPVDILGSADEVMAAITALAPFFLKERAVPVVSTPGNGVPQSSLASTAPTNTTTPFPQADPQRGVRPSGWGTRPSADIQQYQQTHNQHQQQQQRVQGIGATPFQDPFPNPRIAQQQQIPNYPLNVNQKLDYTVDDRTRAVFPQGLNTTTPPNPLTNASLTTMPPPTPNRQTSFAHTPATAGAPAASMDFDAPPDYYALPPGEDANAMFELRDRLTQQPPPSSGQQAERPGATQVVTLPPLTLTTPPPVNTNTQMTAIQQPRPLTQNLPHDNFRVPHCPPPPVGDLVRPEQSQQQQQQQLREPEYEQTLWIAPRFLPRLIGTAGRCIAEFEHRSGATIVTGIRADMHGMKALAVQGTMSKVRKGTVLVMNRIASWVAADQQGPTAREILIPNVAVSQVIGKGGWKLCEFQLFSGAAITVHPPSQSSNSTVQRVCQALGLPRDAARDFAEMLWVAMGLPRGLNSSELLQSPQAVFCRQLRLMGTAENVETCARLISHFVCDALRVAAYRAGRPMQGVLGNSSGSGSGQGRGRLVP
uniref:K Homology domain-containing protein n=1 Tax=Chromera velia CCMP2878 TaxID=1169474 RepID=A0A0G4I1H9_9ALVE|eukprot:Cvel_34713.t1-p1 / transcript=Cvel_34713.t1 / gene=Cvel_34713 / organism=Chromera_velia_CCMP2878 / gene_product=hypothetical protein / transcript_product=hypothetical protein / location=Cvel_scaffold6051:1252-3532(+) / protein_length=648 / sequence_SO=supercontig / SO=protein_coding / is_pseudo=false